MLLSLLAEVKVNIAIPYPPPLLRENRNVKGITKITQLLNDRVKIQTQVQGILKLVSLKDLINPNQLSWQSRKVLLEAPYLRGIYILIACLLTRLQWAKKWIACNAI